MQSGIQPLSSSYRDPSGFMFEKDGSLYRQINKIFKEDYDHFISSGCYDHFVKNRMLVSHQEINENFTGSTDWYKTIKPEKIDFISYPWEWSFEMIQDAALLTLNLAKQAMQFGMMLKDATPFNIQWKNGQPVFIDTLSFEKYDPTKPWIAYRQFCENFVSPLVLMHYRNQPLQTMLLAYPEGIPLTITQSLLPWTSFFFFYTYLHVHLHSKWTTKKIANTPVTQTQFSEKKMNQLLETLTALVQKKRWKDKPTTWNEYYEEAGQRKNYLQSKKEIIRGWLNEVKFSSAIDVGVNTGEFSFLLSEKNVPLLAVDFDHSSINRLYQKVKNQKKNILPLVIDIANPSPSIGVNNQERPSFLRRSKVDLALALAVIHHVAIGKNIPFKNIAEMFAGMSKTLIIEFVPKEDEKIQQMLAQKKDIYCQYNAENFETSFQQYFRILKKEAIEDSGRELYLMLRNEQAI